MCEYCLPLQPYDQKYLQEKKIKHMSFHAYLAQIRETAKILPATHPMFIPPLDEMEYTLKTPCPSQTHAPYPDGICTKCQPSAISLTSQKFRMVDHIEFESSTIIDQFLQYWRQSGVQRAGYLYGRYEPFSEVPLGVKAVVSCIYEPPQEAGHDWIQLSVPDPDDNEVEKLACSLGLERVGVIYTDLIDDGTSTGGVVCKRHADSYFLSSAECIFAAKLQNEHKVTTKYSSSHKYGSRFVTCVVSGIMISK
jgi:nuclear protein localization protein 4 homolog